MKSSLRISSVIIETFINKEADMIHTAYSLSFMKSQLSVILGALADPGQEILTQQWTNIPEVGLSYYYGQH